MSSSSSSSSSLLLIEEEIEVEISTPSAAASSSSSSSLPDSVPFPPDFIHLLSSNSNNSNSNYNSNNSNYYITRGSPTSKLNTLITYDTATSPTTPGIITGGGHQIIKNTIKKVGLCNLIDLSTYQDLSNNNDNINNDNNNNDNINNNNNELNEVTTTVTVTPIINRYAYEQSFAIYLAIKHLNNGYGGIVQEVQGLNETCPIQFTIEYLETHGLVDDAVRKVLNRLDYTGLNKTTPTVSTSTTTSTSTSTSNSNSSNSSSSNSSNNDTITQLQSAITSSLLPPCAFLGGIYSAVSQHTSVITGLEDLPQVSGDSTSIELDNKQRYPKFARTIPSVGGSSYAIIDYLVQRMDIMATSPYLVILNINTPYGNEFATSVEQAANYIVPALNVQHILVNEQNTTKTILELKTLRFRYIFAVLTGASSNTMESLMKEALKQNVANSNNYFWIFTSDIDPWLLSDNSQIDMKFLNGAGVVYPGPVDNKIGNELYKLKEDKNSQADMNYFNSLVPAYNNNTVNAIKMFSNTSFEHTVRYGLEFSYDATILIGLAACRAAATTTTRTGTITSQQQQQQQTDDDDNDNDNDDFNNNNNLVLNGNNFYKQLIQTSFHGASGHVVLNNKTGTRLPSTLVYRMINIINVDTTFNNINNNNNNNSLDSSFVTDVYTNGTWGAINPFIYNNGSTKLTFPSIMNDATITYVRPEVKYLVLSFSAIAVILALIAATWTAMNQNTRIIRASQPFFLYCICGGVILLAVSIIPLTLDYQNYSQEVLNISCNISAWFVLLGIGIIFSAFYSKTRRIYKIIKSSKRFRRIQVRIQDSLIPMVVLLSLNILVLSIMAVLDPIHYDLYPTEYDRFMRPLMVTGRCHLHSHMKFLLPLLALNIGVVILAAYQGWKARHISTEFQENQSICRSLYTIILVLSIGGPSYFLSRSLTNVRVFILSSIIFIACISILIFLFVPKYNYQHKISSSGVVPSLRRDNIMGNNTTKKKNTNDSEQNNDGCNDDDDDGGGGGGRAPLDIVCGSPVDILDELDLRRAASDEDDSEDGALILCTESPERLIEEIHSLRNRLMIQEVRNRKSRASDALTTL